MWEISPKTLEGEQGSGVGKEGEREWERLETRVGFRHLWEKAEELEEIFLENQVIMPFLEQKPEIAFIYGNKGQGVHVICTSQAAREKWGSDSHIWSSRGSGFLF